MKLTGKEKKVITGRMRTFNRPMKRLMINVVFKLGMRMSLKNRDIIKNRKEEKNQVRKKLIMDPPEEDPIKSHSKTLAGVYLLDFRCQINFDIRMKFIAQYGADGLKCTGC